MQTLTSSTSVPTSMLTDGSDNPYRLADGSDIPTNGGGNGASKIPADLADRRRDYFCRNCSARNVCKIATVKGSIDKRDNIGKYYWRCMECASFIKWYVKPTLADDATGADGTATNGKGEAQTEEENSSENQRGTKRGRNQWKEVPEMTREEILALDEEKLIKRLKSAAGTCFRVSQLIARLKTERAGIPLMDPESFPVLAAADTSSNGDNTHSEEAADHLEPLLKNSSL